MPVEVIFLLGVLGDLFIDIFIALWIVATSIWKVQVWQMLVTGPWLVSEGQSCLGYQVWEPQ